MKNTVVWIAKFVGAGTWIGLLAMELIWAIRVCIDWFEL